MPYVDNQVVHDADSHIMEAPGWLDDWADAELRAKLTEILPKGSAGRGRTRKEMDARHDDPDYRTQLAENVMGTKGWAAAGAYKKEDRPWALDLLGFASQLVFTTTHLGTLLRLERGDDIELGYAFARGHNEAMVDFCSIDKRLLPVCYVPLSDLDRAVSATREALEMGASALMIASMCPKTHSPSHVALDGVWAQAQEAGVPIVFHVGGGVPMLNTYKENGLPPVKDFTGGDGNFTSVSFMAIPYAPMQTLATLILDGVLDRFPDLKFGVIEQGAAWVPGWMRSMDSAADAFIKNEDRLRNLSIKPSEFVQRQVRVTPYPHEPAGWVIKQTGPDVCMFSSDYPHTEGGRNPIKRFEASLDGCTDAERQAFYCDNMIDLMGRAMHRVTSSA